MPRPLMQQGVTKLEEMFANGKTDATLLKQLKNELQHRNVPRAIALLTEVQAAMQGGAGQQASTAPALPTRATALLSQNSGQTEPAPPPPASSLTALIRTVDAALISLKTKPVAQYTSPTPTISLNDAHKLLKASPSVTWECIEQTRRTLVQLSHPSRGKTQSAEKYAQALIEARRLNAAYLMLSNSRCGGR